MLFVVTLACKASKSEDSPVATATAAPSTAAPSTASAATTDDPPAATTALPEKTSAPAKPAVTEASAKTTFMTNCQTVCGAGRCDVDPDMGAPCECAWKKLRPKNTLEALAKMGVDGYGDARNDCQ